ncbi:unnamed protein product [Phytophthora lilii]|uniref:Unnamed protein product n=1 Tax=Phytophthora lilii TaxID=2077276 RepID=A0A9W6WTA6_9STRA|nr:unnamed protein product [Phytophthora lilii]
MLLSTNLSFLGGLSFVSELQFNDVWRHSLSDDYLFMFGGITNSVIFEADEEEMVRDDSIADYNDLWRYDLSTYSWKMLEPVESQHPPSRFSHSVALIRDKSAKYFLVCGIHFDPWSQLNDIWLFDFNRNMWTRIIPTTEVPRASTAIVTTQGVNVLFLEDTQSKLRTCRHNSRKD